MFWLNRPVEALSHAQAPTQPAWPDSVVRDTIARIVQAEEYRRSLGETAMSKIWRWIWDHVADLYRRLEELPYGKEITLVLLLIAVGLIVARLVLGVRAEERARRVAARVHSGNKALAIADAERLAASGDFTEAAHLLYAVLLQSGAARGAFRVHPSKTTGDYARELRRKRGSWASPFQSFRSRYDRVIYGDMACSAADFDALLNDANNMLRLERAA
jgi:hypothetical protein